MPIYEYVCPTCGAFEHMQKISEPALTVCPQGHDGVQRKISPAGFILKGTGWYLTDYARKGHGANGAGNGRGDSHKGSERDKDAGTSESSGTCASC
ncbi:MAG TPA: zinc ribbon domain-containing protein [Thermodesulfobacteriota bacterium]|nr:zinc ribbon domain-containing protein [Thermodesulfobacteriota bacterium]